MSEHTEDRDPSLPTPPHFVAQNELPEHTQPSPIVPVVIPAQTLPSGWAAAQSPMPGWLHWLESTAAPASPSIPSASSTLNSSELDSSELESSELESSIASESDLEAASLAAREGHDLPHSHPALLHDARSMVTALDLYCDLLAEPGVLSVPFQHYAEELRLISASSRRLLAQLDPIAEELLPKVVGHPASRAGSVPGPRLVISGGQPVSRRTPLREPVRSLADDLLAIRNLLAALAGPAITLGLSLDGGYRPIRMTSDDLTRLMVNLVRNSADAMPEGGHIQITLQEIPHREQAGRLRLTVTDSGCGLPEGDLEAIFAPGYSTHLDLVSNGDHEEPAHRGMGLAIVRSLVTAAGGSIHAANRPPALADAEEEASTGAVFLLEFPLSE